MRTPHGRRNLNCNYLEALVQLAFGKTFHLVCLRVGRPHLVGNQSLSHEVPSTQSPITQTGKCVSSRSSYQPPSICSLSRRPAPCRASRHGTGGRRRIPARHRCDARSGRSRLPPLSVVHCSISRSPSELPNAAIGRRPICSLMPTGLPASSSMKLISGRRNSVGLPSRIWNLVLIDEPTTCSGGIAVYPLRPGPHELDAAAGHDECFEAVGAQIGEQLQHRLVDQLGIRAA